MCHRQYIIPFFRQDFQKVNDMYCFKFYMPDFKNKEIDSEMFRMISEYQTVENLVRFGCPTSLPIS